MSVLLALSLPPAVALIGMRWLQLLFGSRLRVQYGYGFRFALGLGLGMLVFTQGILLGALTGVNVTTGLARTALIWGLVELFLLIRNKIKNPPQLQFRKAQLWLLLLLPLVVYFGVLGRLSVVVGTVEFDALFNWVFKAKILYLASGPTFLHMVHTPNLGHAHLDYPLLVPALYALNYGAVGQVDEFLNKVWPLWMMAALCLAILSLGNVWRRPHPLPIAVACLVCFLPATLFFIQWEGATIPMVFYASMTALLMVRALVQIDKLALALSLIFLVGCAMTKFEGMMYTVLWSGVLSPVVWRRKWFKSPLVGKAATLAVICLVPYLIFRCQKPIPHLESSWPQTAIHSPGAAFDIFPQIVMIGVGERFFSLNAVKWTGGEDGRLHWAGHWDGWNTFMNQQLGLLPWLILALLGFALWRRQHCLALIRLTFVILGFLASLAFVLACVPHPAGNDAAYILSKTGEDMGRYFYPYFMAWFLGIISLQFPGNVSADMSVNTPANELPGNYT